MTPQIERDLVVAKLFDIDASYIREFFKGGGFVLPPSEDTTMEQMVMLLRHLYPLQDFYAAHAQTAMPALYAEIEAGLIAMAKRSLAPIPVIIEPSGQT